MPVKERCERQSRKESSWDNEMGHKRVILAVLRSIQRISRIALLSLEIKQRILKHLLASGLLMA
jgi:hypothetical protein